MNRIEGKTAVVTGATSGIGESCARLFAQRGANLILQLIKRGELDKGSRAAAIREAADKAEQRTRETVAKVGKTVSEKYKEVEKEISKRFSKSEEVAELRKAVEELSAKLNDLTSKSD